MYLALGGVTGVLVADNILSNEFVPSPFYVPFRLATTIVVVAIAMRGAKFSAQDLGLGREEARRGVRWGLLLAASTIAVLAIGALLPGTREFFNDRRAADAGVAGMAYQVFLRIPFGTVIPEEVCFRGALLGLMARTWGRVPAMIASSALFGLWHLLPARSVAVANKGIADAGLGGLPLAVASTAAAGLWFAWLRFRSASVAAPASAHWATNGGGFALAWLIQR